MSKQQQLAALESDRESNLMDMGQNVSDYFELLETGPILKGLTVCLESYIKHDLVNYMAKYGKEDSNEYLHNIGVLLETIALIGFLKDGHDFNNRYCGEILELQSKMQNGHE